MKKLLFVWRQFRQSLWFIPAIVISAYSLAALTLIYIDGYLLAVKHQPPLLLQHGADAAREMLTTIASSTITVAGVTFSITIVTLSLAASQYTSRILRNFMSDVMNQLVLGGFIGLYTYCLLVLRTVRSSDEGYFVPFYAVAGAFILAILNVGLLIAFIHHTAKSIQASTIISTISMETVKVIKRLYPSIPSAIELRRIDASEWDAQTFPKLIRATSCGYIQSVNIEQLGELASKLGVRLALERRIGQFVVEGDVLIHYEGNELSVEEKASVLRKIQLDNYRNIAQDPAFGIRQIVDVALKALSPGVNDSTTAVTAVDHLSQVLTALAPRDLRFVTDSESETQRVIIRELRFEQFVSRAYDEIRQFSKQNVSVSVRQIAALERVAEAVTVPERLKMLEVQASAISNEIEANVTQEVDRESFRKYYRSLLDVISRVRQRQGSIGA